MTATTPSGARAGGRRFWITVLVFALINATFFVGYHRWSQSRLKLLRVDTFIPGPNSTVGARPVFCWQFNLDVSHGEASAPPPGFITPVVPGQWLWHDARTLTFTPDVDLPRATQFTVSLAADRIRTGEGIRLAKNFTQSVQTPSLEVHAVRQAAFDEQDRLVVEVEFTDAVLPVDVAAHLQLKDPDGHSIPFKLHGQAAGTIVRVLTDPVPALRNRLDDAWVMVELSSGLAGKSGPLAMTGPLRHKLDISSDLRATGLTSSVPSEGDVELRVRLNNRVNIETIRPVISVEPSVPFTMRDDGDASQICIRGAFQFGQRYAVTIAAPPVGSDVKKFPRPGVLSVLIPDRSPNFWFEHTDGYLGTGGNRMVLAKAVNTSELKATVTRVYDDNLVGLRNASNSRHWTAITDYGRPIATRRYEVPKVKNVVQEVRISLDDLLPPDAPRDGVYRIALMDDSGQRTSYRHANERQVVSAADDEKDDESDEAYGSAQCVVTLSDIGLSARQTRDGLMAWAVSLSTGKPLSDVRVRVYSNKNQLMGEAVTGIDGLARVAAVRPPPGERATIVLAEVMHPDRVAGDAIAAGSKTSPGRGLTWLDLRTGEINTSGFETAGRPYLRQGFEAFIYTERGVYRPGETVHLRAIVRGANQTIPPSFPVRWQLRRPDLRDWKAETVKLDTDGAALLDITLPSDVPTGRWSAELAIPGENGKPERSFGTAFFQIEEFIPNRIKVAMAVTQTGGNPIAPDRISLAEKSLSADVQADYLFGRPVTELPATLVARSEPMAFASDKWEGWTFGDSADAATSLGFRRPIGGRVALVDQTLDAKGHANWTLKADDVLPPPGSNDAPSRPRILHPSNGRVAMMAGHVEPSESGPVFATPWRVSFATSVCEAGGRAMNASRTVDVDLVPYYVSIKPRTSTAIPQQPLALELALVAPDGQVAAQDTTVELALYRETWNTSLIHDQGRYRYESTRRLEPIGQKQDLKVNNGRLKTSVIPPTGGTYIVSVRHAATGGLITHRFLASQNAWEENVNRADPERLDLVVLPPSPSLGEAMKGDWKRLRERSAIQLWHHGVAAPPVTGEPKFQAGDIAQVVVRSPFTGELLLTVETDHVVSSQVIAMQGSHVTIPVAIPDECRPNAYITATVVRAVNANAKWQSHRAYGVVPVAVDNSDRKLTVQISAPAEVRPGESLGVDLRVTDGTGKPAAHAAVTVAAVDEGILQLTAYHTPDPFSYFMAKRALGVKWSDLYSALMPEVALPGRNSPVGGDGDGAPTAAHQNPVSAKRVRPVSLITQVLHTDADGRTHADFPVPEFSGQLRLMAVTYSDRSTGSGEGRTLVRSPLMVQSSWPRFAAPGDRFSVPLVVFNNSAKDGTAELTIELFDEANPLQLTGAKENRLSLDPIHINAHGQAMVSIEVSARQAVGVARARLLAKMGEERYQETVELAVRPANPFTTSGGYLAVKPGSPTTLPAGTEMMPGTGEMQVRITPWPTLELPRGLEYLDRYPYGCAEQTISTMFPLIALGDIGKQIAPGVFEPARIDEKFAVGITRLIGLQTANGGIAMWPGENTAWPWASVYAAHFIVEGQAAGRKIPEDFRDHLLTYVRGLLNESADSGDVLEQQAYACYVLALAGKPERAVMSRLSEVVAHPPPASPDHAEVTAQTRFHLAAAWLVAGRRDLAGGLIPQTLPQPRSGRQLTGNVGSPVRDRAIIVNALLAIDPDHPGLPAMVQQLADAGAKNGWCSTQDAAFSVLALGKYLRQMKTVQPFESADLMQGGRVIASSDDGNILSWSSTSPGSGPLSLQITGPVGSKAHLTWSQTGVPLHPQPDVDSSLKVRRKYLDAQGKPLANNTVQSGELVQIEITIDALTALDHLVIDDLLPAGLEIENPRLETTAKAGQPRDRNDDVGQFSDSRVDIRDDRLILCGHLNRAGSARYTYLARAVAPGTFVIPPVRAECMYDISVNSLWGAGQTLTVLPVNKSTVVLGAANAAVSSK